MHYKRMPIEMESPEETGYDSILYNLAESSVTDLSFGALDLSLDLLKFAYIAHRGNTLLRKLIAAESKTLDYSDVLLTNGAAGALFIIHTSLLSAEDHLIIVRPNYATNIEIPLTIGCAISFIDLRFDDGWRIDVNAIKAAIRPGTRLISITTPHNPTGMLMSTHELNEVIAIAEDKDIYLLADETYRDACFITPYPWLASLSRKVISVSSLSKAYGLPGLRMGWIITQDAELMERFLAAKEMIYISNSAIDEEIAHHFYLQKASFAEMINKKAMLNFEILTKWLEGEKMLECILPEGGVVCFPRFKNPEHVDIEAFYSFLKKNKTMVGAGHWFNMPDTYMRLGFGWPEKKQFETGLSNVSKAINESRLY